MPIELETSPDADPRGFRFTFAFLEEITYQKDWVTLRAGRDYPVGVTDDSIRARLRAAAHTRHMTVQTQVPEPGVVRVRMYPHGT